MGLRSRLALLLVAAVVPFAIVLALLQGALLRRNAALAIGEAIGSQFVGNAQARCEDDPYGFQHGRRGPPTERRSKRHIDRAGPPHRAPAARGGRLYAFDDSLVPARADAPRLPEVVASAIRRGEEIAWATDDLGGRGEQLLVAVRVANEGACAVVVAMRPVEAQPLSLTLGPALAVSGFAVLLTVLAAGPLVRRVRRLTTAVRKA
ncbi:MAG: hypothetical protein H5U40_08795, partial [Polyangiaceae bacterium]|nr:hypothetical protein [Polyangiaceae bacterium]